MKIRIVSAVLILLYLSLCATAFRQASPKSVKHQVKALTETANQAGE